MTQFRNISVDYTLGGNASDDYTVSSQKAIKTYVDTEDAKKVDKTSNAKKIYATDASGNQTTISYSQSQNASYLVQRDANAQVPVPEVPVADENAASKKYVDSGLALKPNSTTISAVGFSGEYTDLLHTPTFKTINSENIVGSGNIPLQTQLSGTNGNVVTYTSTTGTLSELGFDTEPTQNSNKLVKSGPIWTALSAKINYTDVVNDLTTGGTNVPLSAEQGKELDQKITLAQQSTHDRGVVLNALTSQGTNYTITAATINTAGTNYVVGDALFLTSDLFIDAIVTVSSVNTSTGAITGITLGDGGAFTTQPAATGVAFVGGSGSGAKFNLTSVQVNNSTLASITNPAANDFATVLSDEIHNDLRYVWKYADIDGDGTYEWVAGYPITNIERNFTVDPIKTNELDSNAVTTAKIANNNVTDTKIADDAIKARHIDDGTIVNAHIASGAAIEQSKINNLTTDLGNKVAKTSTAYQLYGTAAASTETTLTYSTSNTASTIAQRDSNSQISVAQTPTANTHATSKKYVDDGLSTKVDKVSGNKRVYGTDGSGNQTTYDYDSFGKVDDVKVGTTSVLVNKIATLGTMAGEDKDNYVKANTAITGATKCKITYDSKGLVTSGANLEANDIPDISGTYQTKLSSTNKLSASYISGLATVATSGSYSDLSNKPTIPAAQVNSDWNATSGVAEILHKPSLATVATSGNYNDLTNKPTIPAAQVQSNWTQTTTTAVDYIKNKPTLATVATSGSYTDLSNKPTLGTMAAEAKTDYTPTNSLATVALTGSYTDLSNKPSIPAAQVQSNWTQTNSSSVDYIKNKPTLATVATSGSYNDLSNKPSIPAAQVQSNWTQTNSSAVDYIKNKPSLATVATSGSYTDLSNKPTIPTVDQTYSGTSRNAQSGTAVKSAIDAAISSVYKAAGSTAFASKPALSSSIEGYVYNITDAFTTTSDFVEGTGKSYPAGTNIVCINTAAAGQTASYKWDVLSGFVDLSGYQTTITGGATTITSSNLTASRALQSDSNGKVAVSSVTSTELGYVHGVTSAIQTQLNNKVAANTAITGATKCKITYDSKGLVTSGSDLSASDIPSLSLSKISDVTATATELNVLDGITASTTELNYTDGVTSNIQTQLNGKQATLVSGTNIKTINNNSILGSGNLSIDSLPAQSGNSGKFLTTNGSSASWLALAAVAQSGDYNDLINKPEVSGYHPNILSWEWDDHLRNDVQWLRGDTFSWQDGSVYEAAYNHLVDEFTPSDITIDWTVPTQNANLSTMGRSISVASTGSKLVMINGTGYVSTSTDGTTWSTPTQNANLANQTNWNAITYGNGKFIAVTSSGYISTSTDGTTWTTPTQNANLASKNNWNAITYGNGKFVLISGDGYISTSTDGTTWTTPEGKLTGVVWGVVYGKGMFVASSYLGYTYVSTDGITWTESDSTYSANMAYGNGKFVALQEEGGYIFISTDGTTWSAKTQVPNLANSIIYSIIFFNNKFISVSSSGSNYGYISTYLDSIQTDTIDGITIEYCLADDKHKICLPSQEPSLLELFRKTGVAWYYILDTTNQRFKLPRAKHNKYESTLGVVGNGMTLGLTNGTEYGGLATQAELIQVTLGMVKPITTAYGERVVDAGSSREAMGGTWGVTPDASKSGVIAKQEDETDQYKYLYFYVGEFTQTALENTAGLNTELFNDKADRTLNNVSPGIDFVVETQTPSAGNNYTWYRKYKSGWVEQGGQIQNAFSGTVSFPVEMADTNYAITVTVITSRAASSFDRELCPSTLATNGFTITNVGGSGSSGARWEVKGMKA